MTLRARVTTIVNIQGVEALCYDLAGLGAFLTLIMFIVLTYAELQGVYARLALQA